MLRTKWVSTFGLIPITWVGERPWYRWERPGDWQGVRHERAKNQKITWNPAKESRSASVVISHANSMSP